jgi:gluconokinase
MIVVVAGVSGSGKTTVGVLLAKTLGWHFTDGDALHPAANIAKMQAGHPLTEADRKPWLDRVMAWMDGYLASGQSAVLACSALKLSYRDKLRAAGPSVHIVFLEVSRGVLAARLGARHGHFFPAALLDSQLAAVQVPQPDEDALVLPASQPPEREVREIMAHFRLHPARGKIAP